MQAEHGQQPTPAVRLQLQQVPAEDGDPRVAWVAWADMARPTGGETPLPHLGILRVVLPPPGAAAQVHTLVLGVHADWSSPCRIGALTIVACSSECAAQSTLREYRHLQRAGAVGVEAHFLRDIGKRHRRRQS